MPPDEGPLRHDRDLRTWLQRYGVKGTPGKQATVLAAVQPVAVVDDATQLASPLRGPEGYFGFLKLSAPAGTRGQCVVSASPVGGGVFVDFQHVSQAGGDYYISFHPGAGFPAFTAVLDTAIQWSGVVGETVVRLGESASIVLGSLVAHLPTGAVPQIYLPPGRAVCIQNDTQAALYGFAGRVREIPGRVTQD